VTGRPARHRPDGERASVRQVLRTLTAPTAGTRSTATAGELHDERDNGEEINLELLAWLGLVTRSVRAAQPAGFAASFPRLAVIMQSACREFESATGRSSNAKLS
jgi:hypothetical protein